MSRASERTWSSHPGLVAEKPSGSAHVAGLLEGEGPRPHLARSRRHLEAVAGTIRVDGQAHLMVHLGAGQDDAQRLPRALPGTRPTGHGLVVAGGRLHVNAHPVDEARAEQLLQATRVGARGVQADAEAEFAHARHGHPERDLAGRLAAGKHDAVEEARRRASRSSSALHATTPGMRGSMIALL